MADNKKSFLLYCDFIHTFNELTDEEAGKLIKHLLAYVNDQDPILEDRLLKIAFEPIKQSLKRDLKKYEEIREKKQKAGIISAEKRKHMSTPVESVEQIQQVSTNSTVNVSDSVSVNVSDSVNVINKDINISFGVFWDLYDYKKGDKGKLEKKWQKLKDEEREKIIEYLPNYIKSTPDKKYRKHPETFLNNKSWEDEIVCDVKNIEIPIEEINNTNIHQSSLRGLELSRKINWQSFFKLTKEQYNSLPLNSKQSFNQLEIQNRCKIA